MFRATLPTSWPTRRTPSKKKKKKKKKKKRSQCDSVDSKFFSASDEIFHNFSCQHALLASPFPFFLISSFISRFCYPFLLHLSLLKRDNSLLFDRRLGQIVTEFGQSFFKIIFKLEYVVFTSIFPSLSVDTIFIRAKKLVKPPRFVFLLLMPRFSTLGS